MAVGGPLVEVVWVGDGHGPPSKGPGRLRAAGAGSPLSASQIVRPLEPCLPGQRSPSNRHRRGDAGGGDDRGDS
jgi:hypothetical protein